MPGYRVGDVLGQGGSAVVWAAWQDERPFALKVGRSQTHAERFAHEAEALARVGPPWVPRLEGSGRLDDQRPYLLMERLGGQSLARQLEALDDPPDLAWVRRVALLLLRTVQAIHERGLVHRDLKPENVFLDPGYERVTVLDFGLHRVLAETPGSSAEGLVGTSEYMAPEQLRPASPIDARADLYAFGLILYELLTLRLPFTNDRATIERGHLALRPPPPSGHAPVPPDLEALILSCLAKRPAERPRDAATLKTALESASLAPFTRASELAVAEHPPRSAPPTSERSYTPCVLVAARSSASVPALQRAARHHVAHLAHLRGDLAILAIDPGSVLAPLERARTLARALVSEHGAQVVVHVAQVAVRRSPGGRPRFAGASVHEPHSWLPAILPDGVTLTEAARAAVADYKECSPLFGRADFLSEVLSSFRAATSNQAPVLFTLLGDPGLGKTRFLGEIERCLRDNAKDTTVLCLQAPRAAPQDFLGLADVRAPVAILVDDAHLASDSLLDALENATLPGTQAPLFVLAAALPVLLRRRPAFGARAQVKTKVVLPPLTDEAALALLEHQLLPAEFTPRAVLLRLARTASHVPAHLVELVRMLRREGLLRSRAGGGAYLDTAPLDFIPTSPTYSFWVSRTLESLPSEQRTCVEVCAALGTPWSRGELTYVLGELAKSAPDHAWMDTDVGLEELAQEGITMHLGAEQHGFLHLLFEEALRDHLEPVFHQRVHQHALDYWQAHAEVPEKAERLARHAHAVGDHRLSARARMSLAEAAERARRYADADPHYAAVLALDIDDVTRLAATSGRGRILYRIDRMDEALVHLSTARTLAESLGDRAAWVALLLEEATALDWAENFAESARNVDEAGLWIPALGRPDLEVRWRMAIGRSHWRKEEVPLAIAALTAAARQAQAQGDEETRTIALLLLAPALVHAGRLAQAEARFAEVLALCTATGDVLHLSAAHANRMVLWMAKGCPESAIADLRRAATLARELGHSQSEQFATGNLAEILYWSGQDKEAQRLTERAQALHARAVGQAIPDLALLRARLYATCGEWDLAKHAISWLDTHCPSSSLAPSTHLLVETVRLFVAEVLDDPRTHTWEELLRQASAEAPVEVRIEVLYFRALSSLRAHSRSEAEQEVARVLRECQPLLETRPIWRARWNQVRARLSP